MRYRREERGESLLGHRGRKVSFPMDITILLSPNCHYPLSLYPMSLCYFYSVFLTVSFSSIFLCYCSLVALEIPQCPYLRLGCSYFSILIDISVQYTSIPVKLKIIKLFIRELSNLTEGEETTSSDPPVDPNGWETIDNADGWESEESDEEWEDDDVTKGSDTIVEDTQDDLLKGINTKVSNPCLIK